MNCTYCGGSLWKRFPTSQNGIRWCGDNWPSCSLSALLGANSISDATAKFRLNDHKNRVSSQWFENKSCWVFEGAFGVVVVMLVCEKKDENAIEIFFPRPSDRKTDKLTSQSLLESCGDDYVYHIRSSRLSWTCALPCSPTFYDHVLFPFCATKIQKWKKKSSVTKQCMENKTFRKEAERIRTIAGFCWQWYVPLVIFSAIFDTNLLEKFNLPSKRYSSVVAPELCYR